MKTSVILLVCFIPIFCHGFEFKHHNYTEMVEVLNYVSKECPEITRRYHLSVTLDGKAPVFQTVQKRKLEVIKMCTDPRNSHKIERPEVKYIGNMHGNEVVSREVLLALVVYMCDQYKAGDSKITWLLSKTCVHVMPSMNPDGWEIAYEDFVKEQKKGEPEGWIVGRNNANDVDLNRDFPDLDEYAFDYEKYRRTDHLEEFLNVDILQKLQPETLMVIDWLHEFPFVLSSNFHGGDLVVNFPFDTTIDGSTTAKYTASPDNDVFIELSKSYADSNKEMKTNCSDEFEERMHDCITNGARWYPVKGGMQDYNYLATNCFETTIELGKIKFPNATLLKPKWNFNRDALINYIAQSHMGIKGLVTDADTDKPIANAKIRVQKKTDTGLHAINHAITSFEGGDYYRLLVDGDYIITVQADGYCDMSKTVTVQNRADGESYKEAQKVDFALHRCKNQEPEVDQEHDVRYYNPDNNEYFKDKVLRTIDDEYPYAKDSTMLKKILEYVAMNNEYPYLPDDMEKR